jgi:hypothetical protein
LFQPAKQLPLVKLWLVQFLEPVQRFLPLQLRRAQRHRRLD